jgi:predicted Zn finger-like uncharacterized protein
MVSGPLTDACYGFRGPNAADAMLIVCPSCSTSYAIDPTSLGTTGRTVRCARCKATWFATPKKQASEVNAFVDGVIAEADAQSASPQSSAPTAAPPPPPQPAATAADDFGAEPESPMPEPAPLVETPEPALAAEAEPLAISDAPSLVPPIEHAPLPDAAGAEVDADDVESYAARRERMRARRKQTRKSSRWTAIVLVLFAVNVALVGARDEVVRYLPQTASLFAAIGLPVNLRHLKFDNVHISKETQDGVSILIVDGTIVSTSSKPMSVPRLRFAARNIGGQELYTWTALPGRSILGPGETLDFHSRLASPPADASDVMVRFFNAQDADAGTK